MFHLVEKKKSRLPVLNQSFYRAGDLPLPSFDIPERDSLFLVICSLQYAQIWFKMVQICSTFKKKKSYE